MPFSQKYVPEQDCDPTFTLYWRDGKRQVVSGPTIADAMMAAGYGGGAVGALDFYAHGDDRNYHWDGGRWEKNLLARTAGSAEPNLPEPSRSAHYS